MMNKKITYRFSAHFDINKPNWNLDAESSYIVTDGDYDFNDYLRDRNVDFEIEDDRFFFVLDDNGERTGECYVITDECDTDEDLIG